MIEHHSKHDSYSLLAVFGPGFGSPHIAADVAIKQGCFMLCAFDLQETALLSPYRVLDLTDDKGSLCGQILADLGADVVQLEPPGGYGPCTDFISMRYNALAILAALEHKRCTGEGQYIDLSRSEAGLHFAAPAFLDYTVNGFTRSGQGNRDLNMAPHNVYAVSGVDRWVAIGIQTDAHWRVRCDLLELVEFSEDAELDNQTGRQSGSAEIDASISAWTGSLSLKTPVYWNGFAPAS